MGEAGAVVDIQGLSKSYGALLAVDDVTLTVDRSVIFGIVGPNGAGKTTIVECVEGLRTPDWGTIRVLGMDPAANRTRLFQRVGVQLQDTGLYSRIRVWEAIELFRSLQPRPASGEELLREFGLSEKRDTYFRQLSSGQKRRLLVVLALLGHPDLLILDEPTTGLDPQARHNVWTALRGLRRQGVTILVTTHYIEEAEEHCDVVAIVDRGRVLEVGPPRSLLRGRRLQTRVTVHGAQAPITPELFDGDVSYVDTVGDRVFVFGDGDQLSVKVASALTDRNVEFDEIEVRPATLEDLFLLTTGREYQKE